MQTFKQGTINEVLVGIFDDQTQLGITGLVFSDITYCKLSKEGQVGQTTKTLASTDWHETGDGWYRLKMSGADTDTLGTCNVVLGLSSGMKASFPYQVVGASGGDALESSVQSVLTKLGTTAGASVSADIAAVKTDTASALTKLGTPAGASVSADVAAAKADTAAIKTKTDNLPANTASLLDVAVSTRLAASGYTAPNNAGITSIQTSLAAMAADITDVLQGSDKNTVRDQLVYTGTDLTSCRVRRYDTSTNAVAAGSTGLLRTMLWTFTYSTPGVLSGASYVTVP